MRASAQPSLAAPRRDPRRRDDSADRRIRRTASVRRGSATRPRAARARCTRRRSALRQQSLRPRQCAGRRTRAHQRRQTSHAPRASGLLRRTLGHTTWRAAGRASCGGREEGERGVRRWWVSGCARGDYNALVCDSLAQDSHFDAHVAVRCGNHDVPNPGHYFHSIKKC